MTFASRSHPETARACTAPGGRASSASHGRSRLCVGCGERTSLERVHDAMVRLALVRSDEEVRVVVDLSARASGRGCWVHARPSCLRRAAERGIARAARGRVRPGERSLAAEVQLAADRRVEGLLAAARRSGQVALGTSALERAAEHAAVWLCVVASDAEAAARGTTVQRLGRDGRAVIWGTKSRLGALRGPGEEVGVLGVLSEGIAREVRSTIALVEGVVEEEPTRPRARSAAGKTGPDPAPSARSPRAQRAERPVTS